MTKPRAPLTIDSALARIAGLLPGGWIEMARIANRAETTVRRWGDAEHPDPLPLPAAIALDIAYQRAGGEDRPIFETYALQLDVARERAFADEVALARRTATMIRESGEAHEAMVLATLPSAGERDRAHAVRQLEDVVREATGAIAQLRQPRDPPDTS